MFVLSNVSGSTCAPGGRIPHSCGVKNPCWVDWFHQKRIETVGARDAIRDAIRRGMRLFLQVAGVLLIVAIVSMPGLAQSTPAVRPAFEVATIRESRDNATTGVRGTTGLLTLKSVPLRVMISVAYKTRPSQIIGGPSWTDSAMFDVQGKAAGAAGTDAMLLMLQGLLEDRFQLKIHREIREGAVYELTAAKGGPRLKPSSGCVPFDPNHLPRQTAPGEATVNYCGRVTRGGDDSRRTVDGKSVDIVPTIGLLAPSLTGFLSDALDRTVIDKTGLTGAFDFHLEWAPQRTSDAPSDDLGAPSIFTAVQEQLGLRLQAGKGPVEFLVIDHAEKPSGN